MTGTDGRVGGRAARSGLVLLMLAVCLPSCSPRSTPALDAELKRIRDSGAPVSCADIQRKPISDAENAAPIYLQAFSKMVDAPSWDRDMLLDVLGARLEDISAKEWAAVKKHVAANREALTLLHRATAVPRCQFDWGAAMRLPRLSEMRGSARLLCWEALLHAKDGRRDQAWAACLAGMRVTRALAEDPRFLSQGCRHAAGGTALAEVKALLPHLQLSASVWREVQATLDEMEQRDILLQSMNTARAGCIDYFGELRQRDSRAVLNYRRASWWFPFSPTRGAEVAVRRRMALRFVATRSGMRSEAKYLRFMADAISVAAKPTAKAAREYAALEARYEELSQSNEFFRHFFTPFSAVPRFIKDVLIWETECRLARIGVALELHRRRHGRYPETLDVLAPSILEHVRPDPFTGKSLVYSVDDDGKGGMLYSVGINGEDDGGVRGKDDISWGPCPPSPRSDDD